MSSPSPEDVLQALEQHTNVLLYGPPGTGKTFLMEETARLFSESHGGLGPSDPIAIDTMEEEAPLTTLATRTGKVGWVTFHQSYSYEDFVIGLRPDPTSDKLLSLVAVPGILIQLASFARQPGHAALLVIDEINRGNVSRIFGEFITLLEADKRLLPNGEVGPRTVEVTLPYLRAGEALVVDTGGGEVPVAREFTLPRPLYTLASMNSVDKSVAPLDTAIRRRFHVIELAADEGALAALWGVPSPVDSLALPDPALSLQDIRSIALQLLRKLNLGVKAFLGSDFCLGQWYLVPLMDDALSVAQASKLLVDLWASALYPQLEELFHGRDEQLIALLGLDIYRADTPVKKVEVPEALMDAGATSYVERQDTSDAAVIRFLRETSGVTVFGSKT